MVETDSSVDACVDVEGETRSATDCMGVASSAGGGG